MTIKNEQFWSSTAVDPKRSYRWILILNQIPTYVIKTSGKPNFTVESVQHQFVAHTFYYPGRIQWQELQVQLVDPVFPDASSILVKTLQASGYALPGTMNDAKRSFSKKDAVQALGVPSIQQIDAKGNPIEKWSLYNAWLSAVNFGELTYEADNMVNVQLTFRYDWAQYEGAPESPENTTPKEIMVNGMNQPETIEQYKSDLGFNKS
jgi:hypothetical protein